MWLGLFLSPKIQSFFAGADLKKPKAPDSAVFCCDNAFSDYQAHCGSCKRYTRGIFAKNESCRFKATSFVLAKPEVTIFSILPLCNVWQRHSNTAMRRSCHAKCIKATTILCQHESFCETNRAEHASDCTQTLHWRWTGWLGCIFSTSASRKCRLASSGSFTWPLSVSKGNGSLQHLYMMIENVLTSQISWRHI